MPLVSVIVPNYSHARFLRQRVDSILAQTFQDFELILLDDCSTDDSRSILSSYSSDPRVRLEFNDQNSGTPFRQWNKGIRLAQGEYVWLAESDDYADPRFLERLISLLLSNPTIIFAWCRLWRISEDGEIDGFADSHLTDIDPQRWSTDFQINGADLCREYFTRTNAVPNASSVLFRKAIYEQVGGADESMHLCGDWKLWAAMALLGKVAYIAEPLNYFRFHEATARSRGALVSLNVLESVITMRWVVAQLAPTETDWQDLGRRIANAWVPAVMSSRVPIKMKKAILQSVWSNDSHPIKNAVGPALRTIHRKFLRHWRELMSFRRSSALATSEGKDARP